jgi:uncharacterized protein (UPF0332 family)/predicted nucleotidyltransferase
MSKKSKSVKPKSIKPAGKKAPVAPAPKVSPEMEKKLKSLKKKLDEFKDKVLEKFGDYIVGITLMPPEKPSIKPAEKPKEEAPKDDVSLLVVVDDTDSKKMSKDELHKKFSTIIKKIGEDVDKNIKPQSILLTDLWLNCYDGKFDLNRLISMSAPIYDTGMLAAIKIAEIHKSMVIKKFEKYIMSYVLAGSLTQGRATPTSDIDVWIVIDDTDVKKMTRVELKDKLRAIIIGMGVEAGEITGIKNKLNIQVYILTDFWDSLKEANPIIFTLLRDGVPFYDRGIFMPWKQLLRLGRIKPSREAIDLFMNTGQQSLKRIKTRLKDMGMEDTYYAILTPTQAAIMLYGLPPPTPRETPEVLEEIFVKKEKMLEPMYVKIIKDNVQLRKDIEHGTKKGLTGTELDKYVNNAEKYLERIKKLFKEIEARHNEKSILTLYDEIITIIRDVLKEEGIEKSRDGDVVRLFEDELVRTGKVPQRFLRDLDEIVEAKKKHDKNKLTKTDIEKARKGSGGLIRFLVEYLQRKRGRALERARIRVKYGETYGEITLLDTTAYIIFDIDAKEKRIERAKINKDGSLGTLEESSYGEFEKDLVAMKAPARAFIKEPIFENFKEIFGRDVEILMHN